MKNNIYLKLFLLLIFSLVLFKTKIVNAYECNLDKCIVCNYYFEMEESSTYRCAGKFWLAYLGDVVKNCGSNCKSVYYGLEMVKGDLYREDCNYIIGTDNLILGNNLPVSYFKPTFFIIDNDIMDDDDDELTCPNLLFQYAAGDPRKVKINSCPLVVGDELDEFTGHSDVFDRCKYLYKLGYYNKPTSDKPFWITLATGGEAFVKANKYEIIDGGNHIPDESDGNGDGATIGTIEHNEIRCSYYTQQSSKPIVEIVRGKSGQMEAVYRYIEDGLKLLADYNVNIAFEYNSDISQDYFDDKGTCPQYLYEYVEGCKTLNKYGTICKDSFNITYTFSNVEGSGKKISVYSNTPPTNPTNSQNGPRMNYDNLCSEDPNTQKAVRIISYVLTIIKWVTPLIIIVLGMLDYAKAVVAQDDKAITKATNSLIKRLIAGVLIIFIPWVILGIINVTGLSKGVENGSSFVSCTKCLLDVKTCSGTIITDD